VIGLSLMGFCLGYGGAWAADVIFFQ
jgi:hypothetical protein